MESIPRPERRLAPYHPSTLTDDQRTLYDAITAGPRATGPQLFSLTDELGRLEGPFNAFLAQPSLGGPLQSVGSAIRYQSGLSDRIREIAILVVAAHWDSDFERYAHEAVGRHIGLTQADLDAVAALDASPFTGKERTLTEAAIQLTTTGDLDDALYARTEHAVGVAGLFELTTLIGYYATLALQLRVFRVPTPEQSR